MRWSFLLPVALLAPAMLVAACGSNRSDVLGQDAGLNDQSSDGGEDAGCPASQPKIACYGCNGEVPLVCTEGAWVCPPSPPCVSNPPPEEAGVNPCEGPYDCPVPPPQCSGYYEPVCTPGGWTCAFYGTCDGPDADLPDADIPDAVVSPPDVNVGPPQFSCGDVACDPSVSYCQIDTGGVVEDGGSSSFLCLPLPPSCNGQEASCTCVQEGQELSTCGCIGQGADVIVTCAVH